jgi:anti-sigma B factor antagonist
MQISTTTLKRCDIIRIEGRFDSNTAPDLESALQAVMTQGHYHIVMDMEGVEFFGSAAIRVLVMAYKECRHFSRGDLRLCQVPERVRHVLDLAGIAPLIEMYDECALAVGSF